MKLHGGLDTMQALWDKQAGQRNAQMVLREKENNDNHSDTHSSAAAAMTRQCVRERMYAVQAVSKRRAFQVGEGLIVTRQCFCALWL